MESREQQDREEFEHSVSKSVTLDVMQQNMAEDTKIYLALHAPFLITLLWLAKTEWESSFTKKITIGIALVHAITITAYIFDLGDDFAIMTYWSMYIIMPVAIINLKTDRKEKNQDTMYFLFAIIGQPILGFLGIILALVIEPFNPH